MNLIRDWESLWGNSVVPGTNERHDEVGFLAEQPIMKWDLM